MHCLRLACFGWIIRGTANHDSRSAGLRLFFPEGSGGDHCASPEGDFDVGNRGVIRIRSRSSTSTPGRSAGCGQREIVAHAAPGDRGRLAQVRGAIEPICRLNPAAISADRHSGNSEVALRFRGVLRLRAAGLRVRFSELIPSSRSRPRGSRNWNNCCAHSTSSATPLASSRVTSSVSRPSRALA